MEALLTPVTEHFVSNNYYCFIIMSQYVMALQCNDSKPGFDLMPGFNPDWKNRKPGCEFPP